MFSKANEPAPSEGGRPKPVELRGKLLIIRIIEHSNDNPMGITRKSKNAETGQMIETAADCIVADVVNLDDEQQPAYYDYIFLQGGLIKHFKTNVGETLVGIINQYPDQGERKGGYYFEDRFNARRDMAEAESWVNNHPEFFGSQAPGNSARKSNAPVGNGGSDVEEDTGPGSTLDAMRRHSNDENVPF